MAVEGIPEFVLRAEHECINERRPKGKPVAESDTLEGKPYGASGQFDTVGLALSGGGIRSAAFCLGALQALAEHKAIDRINYLSTVSGGGYIGAAMSSAMSLEAGKFPFAGEANDMSDPPALGHLRDHSNYLIPSGKFSVAEDVAIIVRGLVTNVLLVLPVILLLAAITILANPTLKSLREPAVAIGPIGGQFAITRVLALVSFAAFASWSFYRSVLKRGQGEFGNAPLKFAWGLLIVLAFSAFCELQPALVAWLHDQPRPPAGDKYTSLDYSGIVKSIIAYLTPLVAAASLYARRIGEFLRSDAIPGKKRDVFKRILGKATIWLVALALPLLLWMFYLLLVYWGVLAGIEISWLWKIWFGLGLPVYTYIPPFAAAYFLLALAIIVVSWWRLDPNGNSLHRLYRDRLSAAFLASKSANPSRAANTMKLSEFDTAKATYHLINAALNIQGSPEANKRGRNADFFFFAKRYSGSVASSFQETKKIEAADNALSLGTAMAILGAAVSSNMGSASIGPMAPTLALLNLRLGYWLKNPAGEGIGGNHLYLAREIFSLLRPAGKWLYLTDGGHIDNTGMYELLRRRCSTIVAVDAETDAESRFPSFVKLQRYARIDLGVRVHLRWDRIAAASRGAREQGPKRVGGPHCAIGGIDYSHRGKGKLIYVKASLCGDENVYVSDYARRHPDFPHETTGDQFFSEEQFEVYRALGFHCLHGMCKTKDPDVVEFSAPGVELNGTEAKPLEGPLLPGHDYAATEPPAKPRAKRQRRPRE